MTIDTNSAYERTMRDEGREKWQDKHSGSEDVTDSPHHFNRLKQALPKVTEGIQKALKDGRKSKGRVPLWVEELSTVDADILAYVGLMASFNGVLKTNTVTQITQTIGELIEKELLKNELLFHDKQTHKLAVELAAEAGLERPRPRNTNKRIIDQVTTAHTSPKYRMKALRIIAEKNGFRSMNFGTAKTRAERQAIKERRAKLAAPVLSTVLEFSDVFDKSLETEGKNNTMLRLKFTEAAERQLEKAEKYLEWMSPIFKPMLFEPTPWTDFDTGAYHDEFLASCVKLVRSATIEQENTIRHQFTKGTPDYVRAVNALQATPLSINRDVLEVVQWCWDERKQLGKFPTQDLPERPRMPENWQELKPEVIAEIKADIRRHQKLVTQVKGAAEVMRQDLQTAHELAVHDKFYLPFNLDFRGRIYAVPSFNYFRDDHIKALFTYYRGYRVEGNNAYWLMIHLANCGDFEKISKEPLDDRVQWVDDNHDNIISIAKDFKKSYDFWSSADKPFAFVAAAFEYARWHEEGEDFVGYVPVSMDGTNSGVQHYSCLNLSQREGALVNLVPSETVADIYASNAENVTKILEGKRTSKVKFNPNRKDSPTIGKLSRAWLDYGITRGVLKRSVMTFGYSSKPVGMTAQFIEDLMKPLQRKVAYKQIDKHPIADTEQGQFVAASFIADISYGAIQKTLPKVSGAMEYLQGITEVLARENKAVKWTSPSGFPIVQDYRKTRRREIKIFLYDRAIKERKRTKISLSQDLDAADVKKACNAIAPNFIHGCDSAHVHKVICRMLDEGTAEDFFMIHDSFSVSGDAWDLYDSVRGTLVDMYKGDCLFCKFEDEIRNQLNDPAHEFQHKIPEKGKLDLDRIRYSDFCFS